MSSSDSYDDPSPDSELASSSDVMTPRGGFMARPGLKTPPRHAVVVRGGEAPLTDTIPVARSSFPPPAPSEPEPLSMSEKLTLRAIPALKVPRISTVVFDDPPSRAPASEPPLRMAIESAPPPSDAPVAHSIPPEYYAPRSRRRTSGWTIFAAGAAGLLLGLASVMATRGGSDGGQQALAAASLPNVVEAPVVAPPVVPAPAAAEPPSAPSATAQPAKERAAVAPVAAPRPAAGTVKKSIF